MKAKTQDGKSPSAPKRPGPTPRRRILLRLIALSLPCVALVLLELVLRLFGYGYSSHFFLKSKVAGRDVFIENSRFTRRFFPPGLARAPQPQQLPVTKAPEAFRVFVLGESAAMGDPEPAFGVARIVEVLLRDALPERKIEVVNAAVTAINSHVVRDIARDCADKQGDWWIVYMGNNEVVGPFGAGTVFGSQTPSRGVIRASLAVKSTRVGQLLDALRWRLTPSRPKSWEGMEMFLKQQVAQSDPRMATVYSNFERNLDEILLLGRRSGAQVLVSTVGSNLKDCAPFASVSLDAEPKLGLAEWKQRVDAGIETANAGRFAEALQVFEGTTRYFSNSAQVFFQVGRCQNAIGQTNEARRSFERARDFDMLRFRADSRINEIVQRAAKKDSSIKWVDAVDLLARQATNGIPGEEFFYEHVHFNFAGNYLLGRAFVEQILGSAPAKGFLTAEECARRLAFTEAEQARVMEEMLRRVEQPPFTTQSGAGARHDRWRAEVDRLHNLLRPDTFDATAGSYRDAIARAPTDWILVENFARFLQDAGDFKNAESQWRRLIDLMPHHDPAYYGLAYALDAQGRSGEAIALFREALRRRPGSVEARNGLGLALASQGNAKEAMEEFEAALQAKPDFAEARVNLGQTLAQQGRVDAAFAQYNEALRANSNSVAARINLGKLLASQGRHSEAATQYRAALGVKPDNAVAHFNLGNALSVLGDSEATSHFAAAAAANPNFAEAHYNLALGLARENRSEEALVHFAETARLKPDFADGRFNLGVALAKAGRFAEAAGEFQEALRLDPSNERAKKFLEQTQSRMKQ